MKRYSKEELQQDFKLLKRCICEENPLAFTDRNKVLAEFEQAEAGIRDGMTEEEFYYLVNPCVTAAGCGHTNLAVSTALIEARKETALYFPVEVIIDSGKLRCGRTARNMDCMRETESWGLTAGGRRIFYHAWKGISAMTEAILRWPGILRGSISAMNIMSLQINPAYFGRRYSEGIIQGTL